MSTHNTTLYFDRKVLLTLVPLASIAASHPHEGNPNAQGPINFSEIAQSIASAEASISSGRHSTHLTPSLLHGIIPTIVTSAGTSTDTDPLVIIPVTESTTITSGTDQTRTATVWATVAQQTQVVTVVITPTVTSTKTVTHTHKPAGPTPPNQSWPKGECTGTAVVAVNGKCVPKTMVTSTTRTGSRGPASASATNSVTFTISSGSASSSASSPILTCTTSRTTSSTSTRRSIPITTTNSSSTRGSTTSTDTDTDPLIIIPVTGPTTDLVNYNTYTIPASLPSLPPLPPRPMASSRSKSSTKSSSTDDDPLEIIPVTGDDTVTLPTATATAVVSIPVSSGSSGTKSQVVGQGQNVGQMLGHIQGMGQSQS
ncbi:hypothetical protein SMACR_08974 [Sordaria macrospora]|uniref:WGS project CABT00000000 data, contig 2.82 n=2 Tax=Sordaria macrospora TaxID=5147 RepID=F7WBQ8_SORMK|nr:uncharacterized protein SMAC_08974 [Sordaria macrospora k-hell]KAA8624227.1 hypothetical protein SMACR_08974 [Sordaria macrospora]KAH7635299.1 hypothetical protein B0T09DRAFT_328474 [Sordaria sp. MPI-SDFR-AT-0083]WPJ67246.1 hypothetical protein SMAC4_08974 [Sordaria macrospora]CCC05473.1 unnamed protein product [Sordaria macrospora k-hell]